MAQSTPHAFSEGIKKNLFPRAILERPSTILYLFSMDRAFRSALNSREINIEGFWAQKNAKTLQQKLSPMTYQVLHCWYSPNTTTTSSITSISTIPPELLFPRSNGTPPSRCCFRFCFPRAFLQFYRHRFPTKHKSQLFASQHCVLCFSF